MLLVTRCVVSIGAGIPRVAAEPFAAGATALTGGGLSSNVSRAKGI
jgi:hypothetical protein